MGRSTFVLLATAAIVGGGLVTAAPSSQGPKPGSPAARASSPRSSPSAATVPSKAVTPLKAASTPKNDKCHPDWWELEYWFDSGLDLGIDDYDDYDDECAN
jgi:hypothetical protein